MESTVYFTNVRARSDKENKINKVRRLFDAAGMAEVAGEGDLAAVKVHFGERGTDAYINPVLVRQVVDKLKTLGSHAFRDRYQHSVRRRPVQLRGPCGDCH